MTNHWAFRLLRELADLEYAQDRRAGIRVFIAADDVRLGDMVQFMGDGRASRASA